MGLATPDYAIAASLTSCIHLEQYMCALCLSQMQCACRQYHLFVSFLARLNPDEIFPQLGEVGLTFDLLAVYNYNPMYSIYVTVYIVIGLTRVYACIIADAMYMWVIYHPFVSLKIESGRGRTHSTSY